MQTRSFRAKDKKLADDARLLRAWRQWHQEQFEQAVASPHGEVLEQLQAILEKLTLHSSSTTLLKFIEAQNWKVMDYSVRLIALHMINDAVTRLRERMGLAPFDDGVPGERRNVFQTIRMIVT
jgi:hypothetical protein